MKLETVFWYGPKAFNPGTVHYTRDRVRSLCGFLIRKDPEFGTGEAYCVPCLKLARMPRRDQGIVAGRKYK